MLSSSLYILSKLSKTTSPKKLFDYDCVTLYTFLVEVATHRAILHQGILLNEEEKKIPPTKSHWAGVDIFFCNVFFIARLICPPIFR